LNVVALHAACFELLCTLRVAGLSLEHFVAEAAKALDLSLPKFWANSATERPRDFENCCNQLCGDEKVARIN